jgi:hypothetical protein
MPENVTSGVAGTQNEHQQQVQDHDFESWKHFAGMGGTDKNTIITTVSWLLGLTATAIGYIVTQLISSTPPRLQHPGKMMVVSLLGLVISGLAGYLTLLYGGYANRNWAKADQIARKRGWLDLLPESSSGDTREDGKSRPSRLAAIAWRFARPCEPKRELAPVFVVFLFLSILSGLADCVFLIWSCSVRIMATIR